MSGREARTLVGRGWGLVTYTSTTAGRSSGLLAAGKAGLAQRGQPVWAKTRPGEPPGDSRAGEAVPCQPSKFIHLEKAGPHRTAVGTPTGPKGCRRCGGRQDQA